MSILGVNKGNLPLTPVRADLVIVEDDALYDDTVNLTDAIDRRPLLLHLRKTNEEIAAEFHQIEQFVSEHERYRKRS